MRLLVRAFPLALLLLLPHAVTAQTVPTSADSVTLAAAGQEAGARAGRTASLRGPIWGSAAATFFLTPVVGGLGSLILSQASVISPPAIPRTVVEAESPIYQQAYDIEYRAAYRPRYLRAVRRSVLITSVVFFAGMVVLGG